MKSIHDTCETLMALSQENLSSEQLERALTSYKELSDMTARERDLLDRVQLMLKVIGQNLMEFQIDGPSHST